MCMAEFLQCSPETITTLLIGYTPIQNFKKLKKTGSKRMGGCLVWGQEQ